MGCGNTILKFISVSIPVSVISIAIKFNKHVHFYYSCFIVRAIFTFLAPSVLSVLVGDECYCPQLLAPSVVYFHMPLP